ncbi:MAG: SDR family oxidoreductase, partial [Methyloligellaceae bacterium]
EQFGGLDIVVNNAGILRDAIFHKMTEEDWDLVIGVHLKGSFNVARAAATKFREQESGCFVHFTSTSGLVGNFGQANYSAAKLGIVGLSKSIALDMSRFNVTSNCISPFAWSRMIGTIPIHDEVQKARIDKLKQMTPAKIAPLAVALASEAGKTVTGQIFAVRNNEIYLMSQARPLRSVHAGDGWTAESIVDVALPAMKAHFYPLDRSQDVFSWDPI